MPLLGSGSLPAWRAGFLRDMQVRFLPAALFSQGYPGSIPGMGVSNQKKTS